MDKRILLLLVLIFVPTISIAHDQSSPATYDVFFNIAADTSFTVTLVGAETTMNFTANKNSKWVAPDGTNNGIDPWARIDNTGDTSQTFGIKLGTANPGPIELYASNFTDMSGRITVSNSVQSPTGWNGVAPGGSINLFARANFTGATTTANNISIST